MKRTLIVIASLVAVMSVLSCNEKEEQAVTQFLPVTEGDVSASWEGGTYSFQYSVVNPTQSGVVEPVCEADWISDFRTGEYGLVRFTVAENASESERTATVQLEYEDLRIEFVVRQQGKTIAGNSYFKIEFSSIETTSFSALITPSDMDMPYLVLTSDMESMAGFEDDGLLFNDAMDYYKSMAEGYGMTLAAALEQFLITGEYEDKVSGLESGKEYCVFAFGVSVSGNDAELLTPIARAAVTTKTVEKIDIEFDIQVESEYTGTGSGAVAEVSVRPDDTQVKYHAGLMTQMDFDINGASMPEAAEGYFRSLVNYYLYMEYEIADIYDVLTVRGNFEKKYDCEPKSNYWAVAFVVDEQLNIVSEIAFEEFKAPGLESDNKITLEVKDVDATTARLVTTVSNNDTYWMGVMPAWRVEGMDDEYLMWSLVDYYDIAAQLVTGDADKTFGDLDPETEYVALAFGFEGGSYTTGLSKAYFTTGAPGDPSECTFEFTVSNLKARSGDITVTPSDPSVSYYWNVFEASVSEDSIRNLIQTNIEQQIEYGYVTDAREYWQYSVVRGVDMYPCEFAPNTSYKVMAVAIDMNKGDYGGPYYFSEPFTTPEAVVSDAYVSLDLSKYYDGDELYAYDSEKYKNFKGKADLVVKAELSGPVAHWYHMIYTWSDSYLDFSDEQIIGNIIGGAVDKNNAEWPCSWNKDYAVFAVAVDADGNYGKVFRLKFSLDKDGASPIEEIVSAPGLSSALSGAPAYGMERKAFCGRDMGRKQQAQ